MSRICGSRAGHAMLFKAMSDTSNIKQNLLVPAAIVAAGLVIASAVYYSGGPRIGTEIPKGGRTGAPPPAVSGDLTDDDPSLGDPNAPVVVVEFSDFECPFCGRFFRDTLPAIKEQYVKTGKVRFVYRDFPIASIHKDAEKAAEAGECADEQGKFWEYHDKIFQGQSELGIASFKRWAADLGLDTGKFNQCLDSGKYASEVAADLQAGQTAGVSGTPTFYINGRQIVGALPFDQFKTAIDTALAGKE